MPTVYVQTLREFTKRHGDYVDRHTGASPGLRTDLRPAVVERLFVNGAYCRFDPTSTVRAGESDLITSVEPPTDSIELMKAQREFLKAKHDQEWERWVPRYKSTAEDVNNARLYENLPMPSQGVIDDLKAGTARMAILKQAMAAIDEKLAETPEEVAKREQAEQLAKQREQRSRQVQQMQAELMGMENAHAARDAILAEFERVETQDAIKPSEFFKLLLKSTRAPHPKSPPFN